MNNLNKRNLLVCDTAYTYEFLIERNLQELVTCKDVDGYFDHVWTVHAVASLFHSHASGLRYGRPVIRKLNERHTHIEGKIGLFKRLLTLHFLSCCFLSHFSVAKLFCAKSHNLTLYQQKQ